jgi:hypothetical protein
MGALRREKRGKKLTTRPVMNVVQQANGMLITCQQF